MCAWTRPGWQRPTAESASAGASPPSSFAELMSEQLAERLQAGEGPSASTEDEEEMDPDLALAMALSLSSASPAEQQQQQPPEKEGGTEGGTEGGEEQTQPKEKEEEQEEDSDSALAQKLQAMETEGSGGHADIDLALALQLQAEEERALNAARRAAAARDQLQQGQYSKVSVSYGIEEGGREGGWEDGRRVLLSADDAPDSSARSRSSSSASTYQDEEEEEEGGEGGREGGLGGLVGIVGPGGGRRRRQKQGELWVTKEGGIISKHDATVNGRLNALELTARYSGVGDLEGEPDFSIPNRVFNQLRHSLKKGNTAKGTSGVARGGVESRSRQTQEGVLDERTRLILFKMINKGTLFSEVGGVVKTGKESNVYYAPGVGGEGGREGGVVDLTREEESEEEEEEEVEEGREGGKGRDEEAEAGSVSAASLASSSSSSFRSSSRAGGREGGREGCDCAIKVFKTTLNEFSNRALYIDGDPRFGKLLFNKQSSRAKFQLWAEKEARNLLRMHKAGIPCPVPLEQKEHVLVMSFLGDNGWPSPQLREVKFSSPSSSSSSSKKDTKTKQREVEHHWWSTAYRNVLLLIRDLYQKASLVHGDLSEYNILWHNQQLYLIDVGQAVHKGHAMADAFLARDLKQVHAFFRSKGVKVLGEGRGEEGGGEGFVKMVYVGRGEEEGEGERRGRWEVGRRDEEGEEKEREAVSEVLERLIEGREGWDDVIKSVRGVFRDGARREGEEVGGRTGSDVEEDDGAGEEVDA